MRRSFLLPVILFVLCLPLKAQVIYTLPYFPTATSEVTIIYDAAAGNAALEDYSGTVYAHTGVITDASTSPSDWKHTQGVWGTADPEVEMTALGDNKYSITYNITDFYGITGSEIVYQMAFVFRNADGSIVGRNADGSDIYTGVYEPGLHVSITSPEVSPLIVNSGEIINVAAYSSFSDTLRLYLDDVEVFETTDSSLTWGFTATGAGLKHIVVSAEGDGTIISDTADYYILGDVPVADLPAGMHQGINYLDDHTVTLVLFAPYKDYVFAIGDFSNWNVSDANLMNVTPDGNTYWVTLSGLEAGKEYAYQYLIDGTLKVADPLTEKILDPNADGSIPAATYPDLMPYPAGKTSGIVSILQTAQPEYDWVVDDFTPPATTDLVIYELLVRDFVAAHNYQTLLDTLDYLSNLGVNAIEFMPVMEFENNESWGYNPSFFTALDKYYGTPDAFKQFIDAAHERGMAVILDIAMNHAFGQCPLVQMWFDGATYQTSAENPYFNEVPKHDYNVGYDFNHESDATKKMRTLVFRYWLEKYHVDGYRFDLSKGYTQNNTLGDVGAWGAYDASRIAIWNDIEDSIRAVKDDAILILEHFADNTEEKELSADGFLLWGNMNYNYSQATMGYSGSDLNWASYKSRGWTEPHLVTYMESHDEERVMYKNITYGNSAAGYNVKDLNTALARTEAGAAFLLTIPGPKMMWQFGELGYDYSIEYGCRVCNKPIKWDYFDNANRYRLYTVYSALNALRTSYDVFRTTDFSMSTSGLTKRINLNDAEMNATVLGNFDVTLQSLDPSFQHTGKWYEYFSGDSITVSDVHSTLALDAGAYRIYTDKKLTTPEIPDAMQQPGTDISLQSLSVYPNPSAAAFNIQFQLLTQNEETRMEILDSRGQTVYTENFAAQPGLNTASWNGRTAGGEKAPAGIYLCRLSNGNGFETVKLTVL